DLHTMKSGRPRPIRVAPLVSVVGGVGGGTRDVRREKETGFGRERNLEIGGAKDCVGLRGGVRGEAQALLGGAKREVGDDRRRRVGGDGRPRAERREERN